MERQVILYVAVSVDGYLADERGGVGWLQGECPDHESDYGYNAMIKRVDTIIMGRTTYDQIVTELSPDKWMYHGLTTYVMTNRAFPARPDRCFPDEEIWNREVRFSKEVLPDLVRRLKKEQGIGIWICGGADIVGQLMKDRLIDEYQLSVIPVLMGKGIRLFQNSIPYGSDGLLLHLEEVEADNGILSCIYRKREESVIQD